MGNLHLVHSETHGNDTPKKKKKKKKKETHGNV